RREGKPPGETRQRCLTRGASRRARFAAIAPPKENPANLSGASPGNISRRRPWTRSRYAAPVISDETDAESPYEGWSSACTVKRAERASMLRLQCFQDPIPPWKRTRSGPLPLRRTAIRGESELM